MTRSIQDLATETMSRLGLLEAQETASSEDSALISARYQDKFEEWTFREFAWWPVDEIPNMAFGMIADMMAEEVAPHFGKQAPVVADDGGDPVSIGERGRRGIRRLIQREKSNMPIRALYY